MANEFVYTNPEAARQAIAKMQLSAALAENQSRENIAREQTQQQRYATQSQISEREKDRAVSREDIAARYGSRTGTETDRLARERASVQYETVLGKLNIADPLTKGELEAALADSPSLTDDQRKQLRSIRDEAYKAAQKNFETGQLKAKNYLGELSSLAKEKNPKTKDALYKRLNGDKEIIFDMASGQVMSIYKKPREDPAAGMMGERGYKSVGESISPSQDYGGAPPSASAMKAGAVAIPTIEDLKKKISGGIGYADPVPPTAAVRSSDLSGAGSGSPLGGIGGAIADNVKVGPSGITFPNLSPGSFIGPAESRDPMPGPMERFRQPGGFGMRVSDIAPPPSVSIPPPMFASPMGMMGGQMRATMPPIPTGESFFDRLPRANPVDDLIRFTQHPSFQTLAPQDQRAVLDEINAGQGMPRLYDMQTIRPEYRPPLDYYPQQ